MKAALEESDGDLGVVCWGHPHRGACCFGNPGLVQTGAPVRELVAVCQRLRPLRVLVHDSQHSRRLRACAQDDDDVTDPADLVGVRVEHGDAGETGKEHPCRRPGRHAARLPP